ncbi:MAG: response regulator [bacterium]|nr:response regulator [bacterium]
MKILIVDDSRIIQKIVAKVVEMLDFEPVFALNGVEALEQLSEKGEDIGLVLMDWNMPEMNGLDCLRAIRASSEWSDLPVMMLTTESEHGRMALAISEGATHYCTKPFAPEHLTKTIYECLGMGE